MLDTLVGLLLAPNCERSCDNFGGDGMTANNFRRLDGGVEKLDKGSISIVSGEVEQIDITRSALTWYKMSPGS
jgi:hypothetical protein